MIELEQYTAALLVTSAHAPAVSDEEAARLQDAHLAHLAELHEAGHLLAAGPLRDSAASSAAFRSCAWTSSTHTR